MSDSRAGERSAPRRVQVYMGASAKIAAVAQRSCTAAQCTRVGTHTHLSLLCGFASDDVSLFVRPILALIFPSHGTLANSICTQYRKGHVTAHIDHHPPQ